jgi:repressor LexA
MERTARRKQIYRFINQFRERTGYSPSIRDVCKGLGIKSTSNVWYHYQLMERDGLLRREQGVSRSVVVVAQGRVEAKSGREEIRPEKPATGNAK